MTNIMKAPIAKAISDKRRIPTLIPEIVDVVAIAVIIQMIITYNIDMAIEIYGCLRLGVKLF